MTRILALTWDTQTRSLTVNRNQVVGFKRFETVTLRVYTEENGLRQPLAAGWNIIGTLKPENDLTNVLARWTGFDQVGSTNVYTASLKLNSDNLSTLLGDVAEPVNCVFDFECTFSGANGIKSQTLYVDVENDVTREDDGPPAAITFNITDSGYTMETGFLLGRTSAGDGAIELVDPSSEFTFATGALSLATGGVSTGKIAAGAVTFAKMQGLSGQSLILGTGTGGGLTIREISLGAGLNMSGNTLSVDAALGGPIAVVFADSGVATPFMQASDSNAARETALRLAMAAAASNDVVYLGNGEVTVTSTSLTSSMTGSPTGVKLQLSPGTVLLYANTTLAASDRDLFDGYRRNVRNFGAVAGSGADQSRNVLAFETARMTGRDMGGGVNTDGLTGTAVELMFDGGDFYFNDTLHIGGNVEVDSVGQSNLVWGNSFAPAAGTTLQTFTDANVNTGTDRITLTGHKLGHGQRIRLSNSGGALPGGTAASTDYYVDVIDKDTIKLSPVPQMSAGVRIDITSAAGGGTHTVTMMERFAIVVHKPDSAGSSNTTHNVRIGTLQISSTVTGNAEFSGVCWRSAQISGIDHLAITYKERGIVITDASSGLHDGNFWLNAQGATGATDFSKGTPAMQIDGASGVTLDYVSVTDDESDVTSALTGTIDPDGTTTVTGVGTAFTTELRPGDYLLVNEEVRLVTAISTNTSLTVSEAFANGANDTSPERLPRSPVLICGSTNTHFKHAICENCHSGIMVADTVGSRLSNLDLSGRAVVGSHGVVIHGDSHETIIEPLQTYRATWHVRDYTISDGAATSKTEVVGDIGGFVRRGYFQRATAKDLYALDYFKIGGVLSGTDYAYMDHYGVLRIISGANTGTYGAASININGLFTVDGSGNAVVAKLNGLTVTTSTGTLTIPNGVTLTGPAASGTAATLAGTEELDNKTLDSSVGKGTWTASGTWTLPAFTLGGTVSGGGQQLNNIIIGSVTPLAGSFTDLSATGAITLTPTALPGTSGSVAIDFALAAFRTVTLSGNITFTTSNLVAGKTVTIKILADGSTRTFTLPGWIFIGAAAPASIAANKTAILTLTSYSTTDGAVVAAYAVEP